MNSLGGATPSISEMPQQTRFTFMDSRACHQLVMSVLNGKNSRAWAINGFCFCGYIQEDTNTIPLSMILLLFIFLVCQKNINIEFDFSAKDTWWDTVGWIVMACAFLERLTPNNLLKVTTEMDYIYT